MNYHQPDSDDRYDSPEPPEDFCTCSDSDICPPCLAAMHAARAPYPARPATDDGRAFAFAGSMTIPADLADYDDLTVELYIDDALMAHRTPTPRKPAMSTLDYERLGYEIAVRNAMGRGRQ